MPLFISVKGVEKENSITFKTKGIGRGRMARLTRRAWSSTDRLKILNDTEMLGKSPCNPLK
jgi:hypothetical protein